MRILLILGGLRNGYGIDPDKTISPRSISFFIGGKLANACLCAKCSPLARYALMADGEQIHSAMYPGSAFGDGFAMRKRDQ